MSTPNFWAQVDRTAGPCWLWLGRINRGYGVFPIGGNKTVAAHRIAYELTTGTIPEGMVIDHICHNKACVNPEHLRLATIKQNIENRKGAQSNNKSGVRGVAWHKAAKKWEAHVCHQGKKHYLGLFESLKEAGDVAAAKRRELFTHSDMDWVGRRAA